MNWKWARLAIAFFISFGAISPINASNIVTNPLRDDGFGSQYQTIIYSFIYAELTGNKFHYSPFRNIEHNYDNDPHYIKKLEWLVNLMDHFPINRDIHLQTRIGASQFITFFEGHLSPAANSRSLKKIKELFRLNKERKNYFDPEHFHIAIHIRRPNPHDNRVLGTNTPDGIYVRTIEKLRTTYHLLKPVFHIFSQGNEEDFRKIYSGIDIEFHINESVEETFPSLVFADVLVTSSSSFSYCAALLTEGTVYYLPFWHPPLPHWNVIN